MVNLYPGYHPFGGEMPPEPPIEGVGGGGGRATYRPAMRTWALPEHVGPFRTAQVFSRVWKSMAALGTVAGGVASVMPPMDFSQANWPGFQNDVGWMPPDYLKDMEITHRGWDALIRPEEDDYIAPTRYVGAGTPEAARVEREFLQRGNGLISAPLGNKIISRGDPATVPQVPDTPEQLPISKQTDLALQAYEERIAQLNKDVNLMKDRNARFVQEQLAKREYEEKIRQIHASAEPSQGVSIVVRPGVSPELPVHVKLRYQELQDERVGIRRRADNKIPPFYAAIQRAITATLGRESEVQDAVDALAWNMYSLDARGRPVQSMMKYNRNTGYVLREWARGRARLDMWGFAVDYAIQQWSDAAYAFQSKEQDRLALQLGWKAPVGVTSTYRNMMRETPGWENDVSSSWIRSQSRFFRSQDVWRQGRVSALWRSKRVPQSRLFVPSSYGVQPQT